MAQETITLMQALRQIEESGTRVRIADFDSFFSFMCYFERHYKPMLQKTLDKSDDHLLNFFIEDILKTLDKHYCE